MSEKAKKLIKLHETRKAKRVNWDSFWQDITRFFLPDKDAVWTTGKYRAAGDRKHDRIFDGSPIHFNEMLANTLHSMMTNPTEIWFELNAKEKAVNQMPEVRDYLQEIVKKMIMLLNGSNFQAQVHEVYIDLGSLGTGLMAIYEDDDFVFRFESKPIYMYYIEENSRGLVDTLSIVDEMEVKDAFEKFGKGAFGEEAAQLSRNLDKKINILHTVMPRSAEEIKEFGEKAHPYSSTFVWIEKQMLLRESGYKEFPFVVPRWMKLSDEKYGRSPAMKALADAKMLNAMMKTIIRGAQKVVDPPLLVPDDGVMGRVNTTPGGINTYRAGTEDRIFPLQTGADVGIGVDLLNDVRDRIKQHFFVDQFQLREGPQMTATEVNTRTEQQLRLLGPVLGRLHFEFLQPLVGRMLSIMVRKNLLPPNPPEIFQNKEFELEVFFTSQIAKAQRSAEANNLVNFLTTLQPIVEFDPAAADVIDVDATVRKIAILNGVSEDVFRDEEEIEEMRAQRAEQQAQAQQMEQEMAGAEILNKGVDPAQKLGLINGGQ